MHNGFDGLIRKKKQTPTTSIEERNLPRHAGQDETINNPVYVEDDTTSLLTTVAAGVLLTEMMDDSSSPSYGTPVDDTPSVDFGGGEFGGGGAGGEW